MVSVLTFSTVIFHAKLSMALLNFLPFKPSFVPRLWSSSWNSIPKKTPDFYITQCSISPIKPSVSIPLVLPTTPCVPPLFPCYDPILESTFQNKKPRATLRFCFHFICNSPFYKPNSSASTQCAVLAILRQNRHAPSKDDFVPWKAVWQTKIPVQHSKYRLKCTAPH